MSENTNEKITGVQEASVFSKEEFEKIEQKYGYLTDKYGPALDKLAGKDADFK